AVIANGGDRGGCACQVEEDSGIRPFLQSRETRDEDGNGSKRLPKSQDGEEVQRVAKDGHHAVGVGSKLCHLRNAATSDGKRYENSRCPVSNGFCARGHCNPPRTLSSPPKNFCHPYFA